MTIICSSVCASTRSHVSVISKIHDMHSKVSIFTKAQDIHPATVWIAASGYSYGLREPTRAGYLSGIRRGRF